MRILGLENEIRLTRDARLTREDRVGRCCCIRKVREWLNRCQVSCFFVDFVCQMRNSSGTEVSRNTLPFCTVLFCLENTVWDEVS